VAVNAMTPAQPNRQVRLLSVGALLLAAAAALFGAAQPSRAQDTSPDVQSAPSFVDDFKSFDRSRWYVSDGWSNGNHQNCTWSKSLVKLSDNMLTLGFEKRKLKDREFACAEIQTKKRFGYGTYEARMKTDTGSGLNAAFFTYIGPADKQPWYEIDFEILTKDTSKVQVNSYIAGKPKNEAAVKSILQVVQEFAVDNEIAGASPDERAITVTVSETFALAKAAIALEASKAGGVRGKLVLQM